MIFQQFYSRGPERVGGGLRPTKTPPPPPGANVPAFPFFRWIAGAKLRTLSIYFPGTTTTGLFLRWWAILGPCYIYIYFKWGLLHIDALPRTTPDNHVELSSVCVLWLGFTSSVQWKLLRLWEPLLRWWDFVGQKVINSNYHGNPQPSFLGVITHIWGM